MADFRTGETGVLSLKEYENALMKWLDYQLLQTGEGWMGQQWGRFPWYKSQYEYYKEDLYSELMNQAETQGIGPWLNNYWDIIRIGAPERFSWEVEQWAKDAEEGVVEDQKWNAEFNLARQKFVADQQQTQSDLAMRQAEMANQRNIAQMQLQASVADQIGAWYNNRATQNWQPYQTRTDWNTAKKQALAALEDPEGTDWIKKLEIEGMQAPQFGMTTSQRDDIYTANLMDRISGLNVLNNMAANIPSNQPTWSDVMGSTTAQKLSSGEGSADMYQTRQKALEDALKNLEERAKDPNSSLSYADWRMQTLRQNIIREIESLKDMKTQNLMSAIGTTNPLTAETDYELARTFGSALQSGKNLDEIVSGWNRYAEWAGQPTYSKEQLGGMASSLGYEAPPGGVVGWGGAYMYSPQTTVETPAWMEAYGVSGLPINNWLVGPGTREPTIADISTENLPTLPSPDPQTWARMSSEEQRQWAGYMSRTGQSIEDALTELNNVIPYQPTLGGSTRARKSRIR